MPRDQEDALALGDDAGQQARVGDDALFQHGAALRIDDAEDHLME